MTKRVLSALLWFFVTWYAWNVVAWMAGFPGVVGPALGLAVGLFVAIDPMHMIWARRPRGTAEPPVRSAATSVDLA